MLRATTPAGPTLTPRHSLPADRADAASRAAGCPAAAQGLIRRFSSHNHRSTPIGMHGPHCFALRCMRPSAHLLEVKGGRAGGGSVGVIWPRRLRPGGVPRVAAVGRLGLAHHAAVRRRQARAPLRAPRAAGAHLIRQRDIARCRTTGMLPDQAAKQSQIEDEIARHTSMQMTTARYSYDPWTSQCGPLPDLDRDTCPIRQCCLPIIKAKFIDPERVAHTIT